jgi:hypothetical protein
MRNFYGLEFKAFVQVFEIKFELQKHLFGRISLIINMLSAASLS